MKSFDELTQEELDNKDYSEIDFDQEEIDPREIDLEGADLSFSDLSNLNLRKINLNGANLSYADLSRSNLSGADLSGANLKEVDLALANLEGTILDYQIERGLLSKIANIVLEDFSKLDMDDWHTCDTIHCIAGWACTLAEKGEQLEKELGTATAALLLLGEEAHQHFYETKAKALKYLRQATASEG